MSLKDDDVKLEVIELKQRGFNNQQIADKLGLKRRAVSKFLLKKNYVEWWNTWGMYPPDDYKFTNYSSPEIKEKNKGPRILFFDIETSPVLASVWGLFKQNVGLNMINEDWYILSFAAKWAGEKDVLYHDKSDSWDDEDDYDLCYRLWRLLDEADIVIGQNSKRFDHKKVNARFLHHNMKPPSSFKVVDTLEIAKKHFAFTSNKLEYMTDKFCKNYKKLTHAKYAGFELWKQCLKGNQEAWQEMEDYNIMDVLSLEELYNRLLPWYTAHPNINLYYDDNIVRCRCGSEDMEHDGYTYTNLSKFDRFRCSSCGAENRGRVNLISKEKRQSLRMNVL